MEEALTVGLAQGKTRTQEHLPLKSLCNALDSQYSMDHIGKMDSFHGSGEQENACFHKQYQKTQPQQLGKKRKVISIRNSKMMLPLNISHMEQIHRKLLELIRELSNLKGTVSEIQFYYSIKMVQYSGIRLTKEAKDSTYSEKQNIKEIEGYANKWKDAQYSQL